MELAELKKNYDALAKKYKAPNFKSINEDFEIEKIDKQSDSLMRVVRKIMMEKIVNSLGFVEMLMTGINSPRIYMSFIKAMTSEDKVRLERMYSVLTELSFSSLQREVEYDEKKEAELVTKVSKAWNALKPDFKIIMQNAKEPHSVQVKKERSYFG